MTFWGQPRKSEYELYTSNAVTSDVNMGNISDEGFRGKAVTSVGKMHVSV